MQNTNGLCCLCKNLKYKRLLQEKGLMSNTGNLCPMENPIRQVLRWIRWSFSYRSRDKHTYTLHNVINANTITI